jgi:hypothetical protein
MRKLILEVGAEIEAPVALVADLLKQDLVASVQPLGGGRYLPTTHVDGERTTFAIQGGWWYRGEHTVEPHPRGTRYVHRVNNVAQWMRWAVPLANKGFRGFESATRAAVADRVAKLGKRLGCRAELIS